YDLGALPTYRAHVEEAAGVLDQHGVERAHVLGLSFGGGVAQLLALEHPERVETLTLVSTTPGGPGHSTPDLPGPTVDLPAPPEPDWSDRAAVVEYIVEAERPYSADFDEAAMRALAERVFDHDLTSLKGGDFDLSEPWRDRLGEIAAPTLVIHGAEDPL